MSLTGFNMNCVRDQPTCSRDRTHDIRQNICDACYHTQFCCNEFCQKLRHPFNRTSLSRLPHRLEKGIPSLDFRKLTSTIQEWPLEEHCSARMWRSAAQLVEWQARA